MNLPPKDNTPQEKIIEKILDEFGLRYDAQHFLVQYIVDFWIPEINMIIEADGIYGHYKKRDVKRDMDLMALPMVEHILHIKEITYESIKETLWQALNKLSEMQQEFPKTDG